MSSSSSQETSCLNGLEYYLDFCQVTQPFFILDDVIADKSLDKRRQSLLDLAISGRHRDHYLWMLTQSYTGIPKNLRRQAKQLFIWYPKERGDFRLIHEENDVLTNKELPLVKDKLKGSKHACLFIRIEFP